MDNLKELLEKMESFKHKEVTFGKNGNIGELLSLIVKADKILKKND